VHDAITFLEFLRPGTSNCCARASRDRERDGLFDIIMRYIIIIRVHIPTYHNVRIDIKHKNGGPPSAGDPERARAWKYDLNIAGRIFDFRN
jgi:hypothetical protein